MEHQVDFDLEKKLQELQQQLSRKHLFEEAVTSIGSLFQEYYSSASPSLKKSFYSVVCRVATILKTRYTAPGFWNAGLAVFLEAECLVSDTSERKYLQNCIAQAKEHLGEMANQPAEPSRNRGFLFEGHLTVDREPPEPNWLVQSNLLAAAAALLARLHAGEDNSSTSEDTANMFQELVNGLDDVVLDREPVAPTVPPASKEVVAKLPVITVTEDMLAKLGVDAHCAICQENLVVNDKMLGLPCMHMFHPRCLKTWLDKHNSCPICRHELQSDDHAYES